MEPGRELGPSNEGRSFLSRSGKGGVRGGRSVQYDCEGEIKRCGEPAGAAKPCTILLMRLLMSPSLSPSCFCLRRRTQINRITALTRASVVHTTIATMASVGRLRLEVMASVVAVDVGSELSVSGVAVRVEGASVVSIPVGLDEREGVELVNLSTVVVGSTDVDGEPAESAPSPGS